MRELPEWIISDIAYSQIFKRCELCTKRFPDDSVIEVEAIQYMLARITPVCICIDCAQKISDALAEKRCKRE